MFILNRKLVEVQKERETYYAAPLLCKNCQKIIKLKDKDKKLFCSNKCLYTHKCRIQNEVNKIYAMGSNATKVKWEKLRAEGKGGYKHYCVSCKNIYYQIFHIKGYCRTCGSYLRHKVFYSRLGVLGIHLKITHKKAIHKIMSEFIMGELRADQFSSKYGVTIQSLYLFMRRHGIPKKREYWAEQAALRAINNQASEALIITPGVGERVDG